MVSLKGGVGMKHVAIVLVLWIAGVRLPAALGEPPNSPKQQPTPPVFEDPFDDNSEPLRPLPATSEAAINGLLSTAEDGDSDTSPPVTGSTKAPVVPIEPHLRLVSDEEILAFLRNYGEVNGLRDALLFDGKEHAELELKYRTRSWDLFGKPETLECRVLSKEDGEGSPIVIAKIFSRMRNRSGETSLVHFKVFNKTPTGLLLNWGASYGCNDESLIAWQAGESQEFVMRCKAKLSNRFSGPYSKDGAKSHLAVEIADPLPLRSDRVVGYTQKDSPVGKKLVELLEDGEEHPVTLVLKRGIGGTQFPTIDAIQSQHWYYEAGAKPIIENDSGAELGSAKKEYLLSSGRLITEEEVAKQSEAIIKKQMREIAEMGFSERQERMQDIQLFAQVFIGTLAPAYDQAVTTGDRKALKQSVEQILSRPLVGQAIGRVLRGELGEKLVIVGERAMTQSEVWEDCLAIGSRELTVEPAAEGQMPVKAN